MSDPKPKTAARKPKAALREASVKAREGIEQAARKSRDVIAATREKSEAVIEDTRDKTMRAAAETNRLFQEHPITAVAAAAAAGAVLGIFLPRFNITSRATKLAGQAVRTAASSDAAQRIWSGVRDAATTGKSEKD